MHAPHTHYDNLKVAHNAPPEVIRAAYKALVQKYHPDKHPDNHDAAKILLLVNQAYAVLSDPARKAHHDAWIGRQTHQAAVPVTAVPAAARALGWGWAWVLLAVVLAFGMGAVLALQAGVHH